MKRRSVVGAIVAVVVAIAVPGTALADGIVSNGSFEDGTFDGFGFVTLAAGTANAGAMDGWTVTSGTVDWISTYWTAEDGAKSLDMNGTPTGALSADGTISQTLATTANGTYVVQFWLAGNPTCGPDTKAVIVSATGGPSTLYTFTNTGTTTLTDMGWQQMAYSFVATGTSTTISFAADPSNTSNCGAALDNVTTTATAPATGADCKHGGWQAMRDPDGTPFKNQGDCVSFYATSGATPIGS
jgi:choice-of-anchor C domain-containing protein